MGSSLAAGSPPLASRGVCTCYCMCMSLEHRLQILLDDDRHRRVTAAARARGVSVATIVREAIDRGVADEGSRRAAGVYILGADDMVVPDIADLKAELDDLRGRRA